MNKKDFKFCMQQGRGLCHLVLQNEKDIAKYKDIVLWGCLHNLSYDTQCEGVRAEYVYDLTKYFNDEDYFLFPIIKAFESCSQRRDWLFEHFSAQLSLFAKNGNERASDALQRKYDQLFAILLTKRKFQSYYDFERHNFERLCVALRYFGNTDNKLKIVGDLGRLFRENPHYDCDWFDWFCFCLENDFGKDGLQTFLNEHSQKSENVKCFYESYLQLKKANSNRHKPTNLAKAPSVEEIKNEIASTGRIAPISKVRFSRRADTAMRKELAKEALAEVDLDKKAELLSPFFNCDFPLPHDIIIEYAESTHERLREVSLGILTNCQSDVVRDYALSLMAEENLKAHALKMLLCNYTPEDKQFLLDALGKLKVTYDDKSDWHDIGFKIRHLFENERDLPKEFLLYIYNTTLCSCCRAATVQALDKRQWLTPQIIEECRFDSNNDIRDYVNRCYPKE